MFIQFNKVAIFFLLGGVWIPQIYQNAKYQYKGSPDIQYSLWQSIHILFLSICLKSSNLNLLGTEPEPLFVKLIIAWVAIQLYFLKI